MRFAAIALALCVVGFVVFPCSARAADGPTADELAKWSAQLDADDFADRKAAAEKLTAAGTDAIPALSKAAAGESLEATSRALEILKKFYGGTDEPLKTAAKEALEKLAAGKHAASSRRAKEALKIEEPPQDGAQGGVIQFGGGGIIVNGGAIQIAGNAKKVSIRNTNGTKQIDIEEQGRKVKIVDEPEKGIKMEITTTKDGKDSTEKIEAKNAEELKKKNEKAYDLYKQYADNQNAAGGMFQLQINAMPGIALPAMPVPMAPMLPAVPAQMVPMPAVPALPAVQPPVSLRMLDNMLKASSQQIPRLGGEEAIKQASKEDREALKKQLGEMQKELAELEKRLQAAEK